VKYVLGYRCSVCDSFYPFKEEMMICPVCKDSGILDLVYDYKNLKKFMRVDYFKENHEYNIWRYKELLPIRNDFIDNSLRVGWTPLYKSNKVSIKYKVDNLYFKDEGMNPTQSLKDRASVIGCIKALEANKRVVCCSSTGNAASSLAGNAAKLGLETVIFVPKRAPIGKLAQLLAFGAKVIKVDGDYKAAYDLSRQAIDKYGFYNRNAAINPNLVEGKKTVAYEIWEQLDYQLTDWVIVSVGDGCTIAGVYKGFFDLKSLGLIEKIPRIMGVQSEGCSPINDAYHNDLVVRESVEDTIADSIAVGIPRNPIKALNAVKNSNGTYLKVSDNEILEALKELGALEGIFAEPAAACSYAGLIKGRKEEVIKDKESVTVIITGNGLKDTKNALTIINEPVDLKNNFQDFIDYMEGERVINE